MAKAKRRISVYVVSDATGVTAERVISAVLVQFDREIEPVLKRHPYVRTSGQLAGILDRAQKENGLVVVSLVAKGLRKWLKENRSAHRVQVIDLLGPLLMRMENLFQVMPSLHPGLLGVLGEESLRLAESIDFTLRHDDGRNLGTLGRADVIIVGVSRTSKTPTSFYLSCNHNLKVANVPLMLDLEPPPKLFTLKRPTMVGLLIHPEKLAAIRTRRFKGRAMEGYNDPKSVRRELDFSRKVFSRIKNIRVIDVTNSSVEEVANQIV